MNYEIVLGGGFNLLMDPLLDHSSPKVYNTPKAKLSLLRMCQSLGLIDIWRLLNPHGRDYTFFSNAHKIYSRIDFFLLSKSLIPSVIACKIGNILISDHAWVCLELKPYIERKKSYRCRLNTSLLQNPVFQQMLKTEINEYIDTNWSSVSSVGVAWDAFKAVIRGRIIQFAVHSKKLKAQELLELENSNKRAETKIKRQVTPSGLRELTQLKYRYNTILSQKIEFLLFRTRQTYFESGDKAGKLLANYIKHKECSSIIPSVRSSRGDIFTTATDINNTFKEFYIDLYKSASSSTDEDISRFLEPLDLPKLSNEQKQPLSLRYNSRGSD